MTKLYANRPASKLEPHYTKHVAAMTAEGLSMKHAIAAELAFRDWQIANLTTSFESGVSVGLDLRRELAAAQARVVELTDRETKLTEDVKTMLELLANRDKDFAVAMTRIEKLRKAIQDAGLGKGHEFNLGFALREDDRIASAPVAPIKKPE